MALYFAPIDSLRESLSELKKDRKLHNLLFGVLQELATHSSFQVRRYVAILFGVSEKGVLNTFWVGPLLHVVDTSVNIL